MSSCTCNVTEQEELCSQASIMIILSSSNWEDSWGALWGALWGAITSHELTNWGVLDFCRITFGMLSMVQLIYGYRVTYVLLSRLMGNVPFIYRTSNVERSSIRHQQIFKIQDPRVPMTDRRAHLVELI